MLHVLSMLGSGMKGGEGRSKAGLGVGGPGRQAEGWKMAELCSYWQVEGGLQLSPSLSLSYILHV